MGKLNQKTLTELRQIVDGIKSGKLEHVQTTWHCGTAHCIAGHKALMDAEKKGVNMYAVPFPKKAVEFEFDPAAAALQKALGLIEGYIMWGDYAQEQWGLAQAEADVLFDGDMLLSEIDAAVTLLERGNRYEDENDFRDDVFYEAEVILDRRQANC